MSRTVIAGIDGSRESLAAADWAGGEALSRGRLLRLVHVWSDDADQVSYYADPETLRRSAEELLYTAAQHVRHRHPDVRLETSRLSGAPAEVLSTAAETAEILVLGFPGSRRSGRVRGGLRVAGGPGTCAAPRCSRPGVGCRSSGCRAPGR